MDPFQIIRGVSFSFMTIAGIFGNSVLLAFYSVSAYQDCGLMTSDVILANLAAANLVMALTRGLPNSFFIFGLPNVFSDVQCQLLIYVSRVSRAMSICLTCFLSCFQCMTITSTAAWCMYVKVRMQSYVRPIILLLLVMNGTLCIAPLLLTVSGTNMTNLDYAFSASYCIVIFPSKRSLQSNNFALFTRDVVFVAGMSVASYSILYTLYKHGKQVKGIRSSDKSRTLSAEARASKTVSTLVALYVLFFGIDNTVWFYQNTSSKTVLLAVASDIRYFFSVCYSSVFPFIILSFNQKILRTIRSFIKKQPQSVEDISTVTIVQ